MNILAVDTSSDHGSAVVQMGGTVIAEVLSEGSLQYSEHLFASLDTLFEQISLTLDDIDLFAAARGPGSFTGLRIGMATMGGLAFAKKKEVAGISTLAALAWQAGEIDHRIAPVLDARRGEVYAAVFERRGPRLVEVTPAAVRQPEEWLDTLSGDKVSFCGPGAAMYGKLIGTRDDWDILEVSPHLAAPIATLAGSGNGEGFEPLYLRPTSAEVARTRAIVNRLKAQ